jgi:hypothetical protein
MPSSPSSNAGSGAIHHKTYEEIIQEKEHKNRGEYVELMVQQGTDPCVQFD